MVLKGWPRPICPLSAVARASPVPQSSGGAYGLVWHLLMLSSGHLGLRVPKRRDPRWDCKAAAAGLLPASLAGPAARLDRGRGDDLGRSGGGINRPGFERLLAAICEGRVGAVLAIEASRLARNGRDWHTLIEFCGLVGTVIVDEDGIYDPRHPNDRLLLGMKGTMSELELSLFRQRSHEALKQKARRGALFLRVAAGYLRIGRDRIEKDPDQRVQDALRLGPVYNRGIPKLRLI
ncbi:Resolvase, N terminal domain [Rhizobiales bacterium GAS113]|nr:Resolvase, N terminal domain [Rhizobiales bacterium GAS113]